MTTEQRRADENAEFIAEAQPSPRRRAQLRGYAPSMAVVAVLVILFLFVPLLQGFQLSAGQDLPDRAAPAHAADILASTEALDLAARP